MNPTETNNELMEEIIRQLHLALLRGDLAEAERLSAMLKPLRS